MTTALFVLKVALSRRGGLMVARKKHCPPEPAAGVTPSRKIRLPPRENQASAIACNGILACGLIEGVG